MNLLKRTSYEYPRSWMLPLLKDNIGRTELGFFGKYVMPLARKLRAKSELFTRNKKMIEAKIFDNLQSQVGICFNTKKIF